MQKQERVTWLESTLRCYLPSNVYLRHPQRSFGTTDDAFLQPAIVTLSSWAHRLSLPIPPFGLLPGAGTNNGPKVRETANTEALTGPARHLRPQSIYGYSRLNTSHPFPAMLSWVWLHLAVSLAPAVLALNNGLGQTPALGWNPYNVYSYVLGLNSIEKL